MNGCILNDEEIKRIHDLSIRILEEVGVKVPSEQALHLLEDAGAAVDYDTQTAKISRAMVDEALRTAPKEFTLGARNPEFDLKLPDTTTTLNLDGAGSHTLDFRTGKRRLSTTQDLVDAGKIFDAIPSASVLWSCVSPSDLPSGALNFVSSAISMLNCCKHVQDEVQRIEEVPYLIELCKAFAGTEQDVIDRKLYSAVYCPVAPLSHDKAMLEGTIALIAYHSPILLFPMPSCGSTGPASLFANTALANAECLSSLVIFQAAEPGAPMIYGAAVGRVNPRLGTFMEGAVETGIMMGATVQMGKYYGLPTMMAGCLSDANEVGIEAAIEKFATTLPLVMNDVDVIQGIGFLEGSMTLSLEQMLIDVEIFNQCMRMRQGIDSSSEKELFEDIKKVGPGGHFLKEKSTRKAFRTSEFYNSKLIRGDTYDSWLAAGGKSIFDMAHEQVEKILDAGPLMPVDRNTEKLVMEIIEEAKVKLEL